MFTIRPEDVTDDQKATIEAHWAEITDATPEARLELIPHSRLEEDPSGLGFRFRRPRSASGVYWVLCPSDSQVGLWWELRVSWREGYVQAGHYGHGCPAAEAGILCWHAKGAARKIAALHYAGQIPTSAVPLMATADPRPRGKVEDDTRAPWPVDRQFYA